MKDRKFTAETCAHVQTVLQKKKLKLEFKKTSKKKNKLQVGVKRQVNNKGVCLLHTPPPSTTLTSSTAETVLRQSLILD